MIIESILQNSDTLIVGSALTLSLILGFIVYFTNKSSATNKLFLIFSLIMSTWSLLNYGVYKISDPVIALWVTRLVMFFAVWQAYSFFLLMKTFPEIHLPMSKQMRSISLLIASLVSLLTLTPFVFKSISLIPPDPVPHPETAPGIALFGIVAIGFVILGVIELIKKARKKELREQLFGLMAGVITTFLLIIPFNFIAPSFFNNSSFIPYSALFIFPFFLFTSYSIIRYKLLNIRILSAELVVFIVIITSLFETLLSKGAEELIFRGIIFTILMAFGVILIKNVMKEVAQREKIEKLAVDLSKANDKLKVANEKLKELDRQKTEFVSIASHQLRSPLTAIKGYTSMLLEGSFGPVEEKARGAIDRVYESSLKLVTVIEDFLNITRIELGKMKYEISVFDLGALAQTVVKDQEPNVKKRGLTIEFQDGTGNHQISADSGKVTQVVSNIIDNSIKYTPAGGVKVKVENIGESSNSSKVVSSKRGKSKEKVRLTVSDTGVGIPKETLGKLFEKFVRADDAGKTNISGTGLGLYVAKQIVEGLGGKIWAESEGKGKGSQFIVEFPRSLGEVTAAKSQVQSYTKADLKTLQTGKK